MKGILKNPTRAYFQGNGVGHKGWEGGKDRKKRYCSESLKLGEDEEDSGVRKKGNTNHRTREMFMVLQILQWDSGITRNQGCKKNYSFYKL